MKPEKPFNRMWLVVLVLLAGCASVGLSSTDMESLFGKTVITDQRNEFH